MAIAEDKRRLALRVTVIQVVVSVAFLALVGGFWFFQVGQHAKFKEMAENNHQRTLPLRAPRGIIFDRHDRVLVENRNSFNISILREQSKDIEQTIRMLAELTRTAEFDMQDTVARHRGEPSYRPIVVLQNATLDQVAAVVSRRHELPDVLVQEVPTRQYPSESMAAHLVGYVGEANEAQVAKSGYSLGTIVGQTGVEKNYNEYLMGQDGARRVVVNSLGREISELGEEMPVEGRALRLTIDYDMQKALEEAYRFYKYTGAAAFIDPNNGDVLAMTSLPAYDPNQFAVGIDTATWTGLNKDPLRPLNNRLIQGTYPPGSTFKILMAVVGLQEGIITPASRVHCSGGGTFYGRYFQCHKKGGHGSVDLRHAIEKSCNVYFYTIGARLGNKIDLVHKWAERVGLSGRTGIDLPNEVPSFIASSEWSKRVRKQPWYPGETVSVSIGQGAVAVTPIGLAMFAATIANGGTLYEPHLVREVFDGTAWKPVPRPEPRSRSSMDPEHVKAIHEGMWMVVNAAGTGGRARMPGYDVAGKTGTAQANISLENLKRLSGDAARRFRDHGWWIFYAPSTKPEIAGVVFTENSEHGYLGAPIAKHVLETYFAKKEKRPLPVLTDPNAPSPTLPARGAAAVPGAGGGR
ncbi:MAG TPA: penicillin-binding protein 2 [Vicinamibacterales bacterium]|nr:penicillin-binding protein 2 [Vicinamibacterales bacterium]